MIAVVIVAVLAGSLAGALGVFGAERIRRRRALGQHRQAIRRIAFPFTGQALSEAALVAALRIARAEGATLMPVYLALVPLRLPIEVPMADECDSALAVLEAVERRALRAEVPVDSRIERGRTVRHALRELIAHERFQRMVVAAARIDGSGEGLPSEDIAWLMEHADVELVALRPSPARPAGAERR